MRSWKTSLAGIGLILTAVSHLAVVGFTPDPTSVTQILAGFGLIFAKDSGVTGGGTPSN